jgi:hypothetical protein
MDLFIGVSLYGLSHQVKGSAQSCAHPDVGNIPGKLGMPKLGHVLMRSKLSQPGGVRNFEQTHSAKLWNAPGQQAGVPKVGETPRSIGLSRQNGRAPPS